MKFIYDEAEAIRKKQEIDAETPIKNRQAKIHNAILATALLLGCSLLRYLLLAQTLQDVSGGLERRGFETSFDWYARFLRLCGNWRCDNYIFK